MEHFCGSQLLEDTAPTDLPAVSKCMQNTVLVWIPAIFTLAFFPFFLSQARRVSKRFYPLPYSYLLVLKIILCSLLTAIYCYVLFYNLGQAVFLADYIYPVLMILSHGFMIAGHFVRKRCGMVTSGIQHVSALIFLITGFPELYQRLRMGMHFGKHMPSLNVLYYYYYGFLILYCFLLCFADRRKSDDKTKRSPELNSSFLNRLTHWWFNPITLAGARKDLEIDDLFDLNPGTSTTILTNLWLKRWSQDQAWISIKRLFFMFKWEFLSASFFKLCADLLQFANPFLLRQMIGFVTKDNPWWQGLGYAVLMFTLSEIRSLIQNYYIYIMMRLGVKVQTTMTAAVYRKTLLLSNSSRRNRTVGEIVNLMSIDVDVFYVTAAQIQQLWSTPLQITLVLTYLYFTLGYSAAVGILIMSFFIPFNLFTSVIVKNWQTEQMRLKDERAKMVNEVLNGIKVVKLYAWEKPMQNQIEDIRERELVLIKKGALVKNLIDAFNTSSPFLVALFTFSTFVLSDLSHQLTPQVAFVALTLFNQLRSNMNMVAFVINQGVQTFVSYKRLANFFAAEELDSSAVDKTADHENSAELIDFSANWDLECEKRTLDDVSVTIPKGNFLVVVGKVGCGKSSLLSALLGEMERLRGTIGVSGRLAYVPQQAWIQNLTVRDNILFGKPYNKYRYKQVLDACALVSDLKILPHGDQTEIGEKGINLSGGQKARISLARAVYQDFDVYLLDDPLSAVDSHVGKHIFEKVIGPNGVLKNKTRILVTHGLVYTKQADEIIVLDDGRIVERGTYATLSADNGKFASFLEEYAMEKNEDGKKDIQSNGEELNKDEVRPRAESVSSSKPENDVQKLINKESVESGQVKLAVYKMYMRSASYWRSFVFFIFLVSSMSFQVARSFWLSTWSNQYRSNETLVSPGPFIAAYAAFGLIESLSVMISFIFIVFAGLTASRNLHSPLIRRVMRSPMEFFDTTPLGRILNRCTKDIEVVDFSLPSNFRLVTMSILQVLFTLVAIVIATPAFVVAIVPLATLYYFVLRFFVNTSRQLTRLQSTSRSPIFSHFGETLQGASSIRAFDKVNDFHVTAGQVVDRYIRCKYLDVVSTRWLAVRLEFIGNLVIFFAALFAVIAKEFDWTESPGTVGVSISYALSITDVLNLAVRHVSQVENSIVAVERIKEYSKTKTEAPWVIEETRPANDWPSSGVVTFEKYSTRYKAGLDLVLQEITANVSSGEKIGIVGRTGAGKSSFALALFRLIEPAEGEIIIDGVDVSKIGLHDLRSALTIIPQDPVLFSGTLRFNLDPFEKCTDQEIWHALELAHLKEMASSFEKGLSHHISEGGENISVGQRQLVCLARALLRRTRILVLDEATAAVDVATDALIQATIREQFRDCTVFTIAHRLNTILDYDRIMVLDKGQIAEFDSPDTLLEDKHTIFSRMVADSKETQ